MESCKRRESYWRYLYKVENNFNFINPSQHISQLLEAYKLLQNIDDAHWKTQKTKELKSIIEMCAGLYLEASADSNWATQNETINVNIEALNRSDLNIELESLMLWNGNTIPKNIILKNNSKEQFKVDYLISTEEHYSTPYWLDKKGTLGMYNVDNKGLIGKPETPRNVAINFNLKINTILFQ